MANRIGLTGGIGSGKSTVANLFRELGVPVFDADQVARELTQPDTDCGKEIIALFGDEIVVNYTIDRKMLGDRAFADKALLTKLEAILHPAIREKLYALADAASAPYAILEIQLLIENKLYKNMHKTIVVHADKQTRISRLQQSRGLSLEKIENIMRHQASDAKRREHADFMINNNGDLDSLKKQVHHIHVALQQG